jgi:lysyl oxidase
VVAFRAVLPVGRAVAIVVLAVTATFALPDLTPELYGIRFDPNQTVIPGDVAEGCAGATGGRLLLRFGVRFHNVGLDPLVIGDPGCPLCVDNPGALCADPRFICSPADGHNHPHFIGFASYRLMDFQGNVLREGGKKSFCVRDNRCPDGTRFFDCTNQGLRAGCVDDYDPSLGCQYIDVTDVPRVTTRALRLRATLDPEEQLPDADRGNNVTQLAVPGCGDGIVQPGEECDPAATPVDPCCGADCRLAPPGTPCEPPAGPCGPVGAPFPDGTPCGPGAPPCLVAVCRAGVCVPETGDGGCLIGGNCVAPGALDPVDGCQRCDPSTRTDAYSRNVDPDPAGLRCQASRVRRALVAMVCRPRAERRLERRLAAIDRALGRLAGDSPALATRLQRRLTRDVGRLVRGEATAKRVGCDVGTLAHEVDVLVAQIDGYARR